MAEFPAPSAHARMLQASGNGLQRGEHIFTAIRFQRNRITAYGTFTMARGLFANAARPADGGSPHIAPLMASRVGQYRDGLLAITDLHFLLYIRRGLLSGYKPTEAFAVAEVRSITPVRSRFKRPIALVFVDGSRCELDAGSGRERDHLFEVLAALRAASFN